MTSASTPEWALMLMPSPFLMSQTSQFLTWQDCCLRNIGSHPGHARLKTFSPRQNGCHFADNIFKCIFFNENYCIISLKCFPKCPIDNMSALVQVMAWCHQAPSHYLNQCWPISMTLRSVFGLNELKIGWKWKWYCPLTITRITYTHSHILGITET